MPIGAPRAATRARDCAGYRYSPFSLKTKRMSGMRASPSPLRGLPDAHISILNRR